MLTAWRVESSGRSGAALVFVGVACGARSAFISEEPSTTATRRGSVADSRVDAVIARKDAACGEGLRNPSCTGVTFKLPGSLQQLGLFPG
jgi:hypothetical protein